MLTPWEMSIICCGSHLGSCERLRTDSISELDLCLCQCTRKADQEPDLIHQILEASIIRPSAVTVSFLQILLLLLEPPFLCLVLSPIFRCICFLPLCFRPWAFLTWASNRFHLGQNLPVASWGPLSLPATGDSSYPLEELDP